jgi:prophage regulatory protein
MPIKFLRRPEVRARTGKPDSTIYEHIRQGLFTPAVPLGGNTAGWPEHEISAINVARLGGCTDGEVRHLVAWLVGQRPEVVSDADVRVVIHDLIAQRGNLKPRRVRVGRNRDAVTDV